MCSVSKLINPGQMLPGGTNNFLNPSNLLPGAKPDKTASAVQNATLLTAPQKKKPAEGNASELGGGGSNTLLTGTNFLLGQ